MQWTTKAVLRSMTVPNVSLPASQCILVDTSCRIIRDESAPVSVSRVSSQRKFGGEEGGAYIERSAPYDLINTEFRYTHIFVFHEFHS